MVGGNRKKTLCIGCGKLISFHSVMYGRVQSRKRREVKCPFCKMITPL